MKKFFYLIVALATLMSCTKDEDIDIKDNALEGWTTWKTGHIYEECWGEDYDATLYYKNTEYPGIRYCMIKDAWRTQKKDSLGSVVGDSIVGDYFFYWNTSNDSLYIPLQNTGLKNNSGVSIYVSTGAEFYNAYYNWDTIVPSQHYFNWAIGFNNKNGFANGYYDGYGGFYLADWMVMCNNGVPTGSGFQFGGDQDIFIADSFFRPVNFNDKNHIGNSESIFRGLVTSMCVSESPNTPNEFSSVLRYAIPEDTTATTTTYYIENYFGKDHCLTFNAPIPSLLADGSKVTVGNADQFTGLYYNGNRIFVSISGGKVSMAGGSELPTISLSIKAYCKDNKGKVTDNIGSFNDVFTAKNILMHYKYKDIKGGSFNDYLGTWDITSTTYSMTPAERYYEIQIFDGGDNTFKIVNMSGYKSYFADTIVAKYDSSYQVMRIHSQNLNCTYGGQAVSLCLLDPDEGGIYTTSIAEIYGGICHDGNLAFVNIYGSNNICGFYYKAGTTSIGGVYNVFGNRQSSSVQTRSMSSIKFRKVSGNTYHPDAKLDKTVSASNAPFPDLFY